MHAQRSDLAKRGLLELHDNYLAKLYDPVYEMCARGLPLNVEKQRTLIAQYEARSRELVAQLSQPINPRSPKAKLDLLRAKGYKLPTKRATGKESSDELSLKKLRLQHPEDTDLKALLEVAGIEKALSSYLRVRTLGDHRIRFTLDAHGTETGRMSSGTDVWRGGFNAQTMSDYVKQMIEWPAELDRVFIEIDLSQAETRFVAMDACEENLLGMIDRREDIHRYVAAEIYQKPMAEVTHDERQLGKKSGHGANYSMGVTTFQDSCLKEMDLVLDRKMASRVLESYHKLFPGIRRWHARLRDEVYRERRLSNPFGRVRYFYGRMDDNTYREAYAYRPQSTVPDVTNHLMLALMRAREAGTFEMWLHCQIHDSVLLSCRTEYAERIMKFAAQTALWHPEIVLPAGRLVIPTESKWGRCLGSMQKHK
jgi:DNA polymerase-1